MPSPNAGFAVVKLATEKATGGEYAVKIMALPEKGRVVGENENTRDDIFKEIDILVGLNHPNVIYLKEYFEESNKVHILASLAPSELLHVYLCTQGFAYVLTRTGYQSKAVLPAATWLPAGYLLEVCVRGVNMHAGTYAGVSPA